jgi:SAM-dependent methyltransferase
MTDPSAGVQRHYRSRATVERILKALADDGQDTARLTAEMLYPLDQFHGRGIAATRENVARLGLDATKHVLDVGAGVGGPARYIAANFGCRVTGIDLTEEFVAAAIELTQRCGLADKVSFRQGNALKMPFADAGFDAATCFNVTMNIADKAGLAREIGRVLKRSARLVWTEAAQGPAGAPIFPLPWARTPDISFLAPPAAIRAAIEAGGFRIVEWIDESPNFGTVGRDAQTNPQTALVNRQANEIVMGEDFLVRVRNVGSGIAERRLIPILAVAERL